MQTCLSEDMSKRNLLICFDAFGTLFAPKRPIAQQYGTAELYSGTYARDQLLTASITGEVARSFGLSGFTDTDVANSFKQAFVYSTDNLRLR